MTRAALALAALLGLSACSEGASEPKAPAAPPKPVPTAAEKAAMLAALPAPYNAADLDNGRRVFARCRSCHTITEGGPDMTGPNLYGVFGRQAGAHGRYNYSPALKAAGFAWDGEKLDHWLENPRTFLKGTKMSFAGIPDAADRRDVIAWLKVETGYAPQAAAAEASPAATQP
jgi:cytochrome c